LKSELKLSINIMKNFSILLLLILLIPFGTNAQCRSFTKKKCIPEISPYIHNGQMNSAVLFPGDSADIMLTFYSGQEYRLVICSEEQLGDVSYKVSNIDKKLLYDSKSSEKKSFDFKVASTQQLIVSVAVPESENTHDLDFQGCVAILVGFKH